MLIKHVIRALNRLSQFSVIWFWWVKSTIPLKSFGINVKLRMIMLSIKSGIIFSQAYLHLYCVILMKYINWDYRPFERIKQQRKNWNVQLVVNDINLFSKTNGIYFTIHIRAQSVKLNKILERILVVAIMLILCVWWTILINQSIETLFFGIHTFTSCFIWI